LETNVTRPPDKKKAGRHRVRRKRRSRLRDWAALITAVAGLLGAVTPLVVIFYR
jgi:hypothetical protein